MSNTRKRSLYIESHIHMEPGHVGVASYSDDAVTGTTPAALDRAIREAQRYISGIQAIKRHIAKHGLGEPLPYTDSRFRSQDVTDAWATLCKTQLEDDIFNTDLLNHFPNRQRHHG